MRVEDRSTHSMPGKNGTARRSAFSCAAPVVLVFFLTALCGCGSMKPVRYYQLTHPPLAAPAGTQAPLDVTILVRQFHTTALYREDRIVYGGESVQLGLYQNDRWAEPPAGLLQDALARGLRSSGAFRAVTTLRSDIRADYALTGQLYAFREVSGNGIVARLQYDVQLTDLKKDETIWRHTYNHDEPSSGNTVADIATAMDKNVHQSVQEVQDGVLQALMKHLQK